MTTTKDDDEDEAINSRLNKSVKNKYECESDTDKGQRKKTNHWVSMGSVLGSEDIVTHIR